jgi:PAS domain S-box-containing protein
MEERVRVAAVEERLRLLIDSVKDYAIFMLDPQGNIQTWNAGAERIKQYSPAEALGKHMSIFYPPEEIAAGKPGRLLEQAAREGRVEDEGWRLRKDGTPFWADVVLSAARSESGELLGFAKVTRDLTDRRAAEEELRQSEERFRSLVENVSDYAIFMLDPQGRIQSWNSGAQRIKQYQRSEVAGRSVSIFYTPEDRAAHKPERILESAAREGRVEDEGWRVRKDGTRFWADVVITALRGPHGELRGFSKVTRDVTERRRAEEERMRLAQSQQAVRVRDEFLSIASHELKTPLTALLLQVQNARRVVDGAAAASLDVAVRSAHRLTALIETLLDVSRMASGTLSLELESQDLRALAQEVIDRLEIGAAHVGAKLSLRAVEPVAGHWDALRISQVLTNLVSNAIRYGAGTPVEVTLRREGQFAVLEVGDRGPGVPENDLERIFGRFERAVSIRNFGGLGLGLYVARQIVEAHGGKITAQNRPEGGACFVVRLPVDARPQ